MRLRPARAPPPPCGASAWRCLLRRRAPGGVGLDQLARDLMQEMLPHGGDVGMVAGQPRGGSGAARRAALFAGHTLGQPALLAQPSSERLRRCAARGWLFPPVGGSRDGEPHRRPPAGRGRGVEAEPKRRMPRHHRPDSQTPPTTTGAVGGVAQHRRHDTSPQIPLGTCPTPPGPASPASSSPRGAGQVGPARHSSGGTAAAHEGFVILSQITVLPQRLDRGQIVRHALDLPSGSGPGKRADEYG